MSVPHPRVTIVVTQRESFVHTRRSLESLYSTTRVPFSLVYVDGGSPPFTRGYLAREAKARGFQLVRRPRFVAPNEARNIGFSFVESEFVAFVENDVRFGDGWLDALIECADRQPADVVGPLISFREPAFSIVHSAGGSMRFDKTATGNTYRNIQRARSIPISAIPWPLERTATDFVEFHCFLARADIVRRFPFDEALKSCLEFDDFCLTVAAAGGVIMNEPAALVHHMLPVPPPRGLGDRHFLKTRWSPEHNAASVRHFCSKWKVRDDDSFIRGVSHWCDMRPYTTVANTGVYRLLRRVKRTLQALKVVPQEPARYSVPKELGSPVTE